MVSYKPLKVNFLEMSGLIALENAIGKPVNREPRSFTDELKVAKKLILRGDEHSKAVRGVNVYFEIEMQIGFMIEWDTYRIGIDCLSTTSSMHGELAKLTGGELAIQKQKDLSKKIYKRVYRASYQTIRRIYLQRKNHRHPDWKIFCKWIETLPYFKELIYPESNNE